jgi:hypothetical protein
MTLPENVEPSLARLLATTHDFALGEPQAGLVEELGARRRNGRRVGQRA